MMTREEVARIFERIALLLEVKGENPFKIRAYRQGAEAVLNFGGDIVGEAARGALGNVPGLGEALRQKLEELARTGRLEFYEKLRAEFPETIFDLFKVPGIGAKRIATLYADLGVATLTELKAACETGAVSQLPGFGAKMAQKILDGLSFLETAASEHRACDVAHFAKEIQGFLRTHRKVGRAEVAGGFRRGKEVVHDLDFVASSKHPEQVIADFVKQTFALEVLLQGPTKASIRLTNGAQCDLRVVAPHEYPCALVYFTGSKEHNIALRSRALKRGWSLNEYGLEGCGEKFQDEADVYRALGLEPIPPELREDRGEIESAEKGLLPRLLEVHQLRGTFHCHTTASDGHASLEEMAAAARELGMEYLGIADHSRSSVQANGLDVDRLRAQGAEIHAWNSRHADEKFRLLAGCEVDILKDGSLDFPDEVLAELDYVVASVHSVFGLPEPEMTRRLIRAAENPHVTMLGHLTGRLLLKRDGYAVNVPAVIDACAATGTWIELNSNPYRLDMDWRWWKLAREKGVRCVINPDAHSVREFDYLWYGVRSARKGWLTREDVVNCLPLPRMQEALREKRSRHSA